MPADGITRDYTWEDVLALLMKDMGLDPTDRQHRDFWYLGAFKEPEHLKEICIRITKYEEGFSEYSSVVRIVDGDHIKEREKDKI